MSSFSKWRKTMFIAGYAFACLATIATHAKTATLTILSFNDVYEIEPGLDGRGGFAHLQTLLNRERALSTHHITTMNGDFLSPCMLSIFDKGAHRIDLFNMLGVDVVVAGNHEFDFGPDVVKQRIQESHFPWFAANAIGLDGNPFTGDQQTILLDIDGIKVGFFGLITVETPELSSTEKKVCFAPIAFTANQMVTELKEQGADVIVALTHLFIDDDRKLAKEVPGIDVILGGHDHDPITWYDDKTFVHKSGQNAYYLARIDLIIEKQDDTSKVRVFPSWNVILNKGIDPDPIVAARVAEYQKTLDQITASPIGIMDMECDSLYSNVRARETEIGNFIADALRFNCHADIAIISGGIIRGNKFYQRGSSFSMRDLLTELPFGNINVMVEISGRDILAALENGVSQVEGKAGRFPQVSGISFVYDVNQPVGRRIIEAAVRGEPIDQEAYYKVATVDYMFNGGDGYNMFKGGKVLLSPLQQKTLVSSVVEYAQALSSMNAVLEGRIVVKGLSKKLDDAHLPN